MKNSLAKQLKTEKAFPDKLFYKIGEVSKIAGVEPYVLRYWETEFPFLKPRKSKSGQRIYVKKDLELIFQIKDLLYKEGFKIAGARKMRREAKKKAKEAQPEEPAQLAITFDQMSAKEKFASIKAELQDVLELVRGLGESVQRDADTISEGQKEMEAEA